MNKILKSEYFVLFGILVIFFAFLPFFYLHQGSSVVDVGREFYIPSQMLKGEILYKDILNIYGALAYQVNAFLFQLFGEKITTLYHFGIFNSLIIILTMYFLAREFSEKRNAFFLSTLTIFAVVYPVYIFNTNLPYSFSFVYALSSFLLSSLFLIKYIKTENIKFALLSCFFIGISIASKLDFAFSVFVFIYVFCFLKPLSLKNKFLALACFGLVPSVSTVMLYFNGVRFEDIKHTIALIISMSHSDEFAVFYKNGYTLTSVIRRIMSLAFLGAIYFWSKYRDCFNIQNKLINYCIDMFALIIISLSILSFRGFSFSSLPLLLIVILFAYLKKIYTNISVYALTLLTIAACLKFSLYINTEHFGVFLLPLLLLTFDAILKNNIKEEQHKYLTMLLYCAIICTASASDFYLLKYKNFLLKTPKGNIYTTTKEGVPQTQLRNFIENNLSVSDKILILPEGVFTNFYLSQKSDSYYYSFIPLYVSMLNENNIIETFLKNLPEYIVITSQDESDFGKRFICVDYAKDFCKMVYNNYKSVAFLNETSYKMVIYKRNE